MLGAEQARAKLSTLESKDAKAEQVAGEDGKVWEEVRRKRVETQTKKVYPPSLCVCPSL